jgi:hypothetical protein
MGKKRRLNSSMAKFGLKHANHPRMAILLAAEAEVILEDKADVPAAAKVEEPSVEAPPLLVVAAAIIEEEAAVATPKATPRKKRPAKKSKASPRRKTAGSKKKTTESVAT